MNKSTVREIYRQMKKLRLVRNYKQWGQMAGRSDTFLLGIKDQVSPEVRNNLRGVIISVMKMVPDEYKKGYLNILNLLAV